MTRRRIRLLAAAALVFLAPVPPAGGAVPGLLLPLGRLPVPTPPAVSAPAWILADDTFNVVLASDNPHERRPMASTTKLMTALVAVEEGDPAAEVVVSERAAAAGEAEIGLVAGERFPLGELVTILLVRSANDAAVAVAEAVGGSVESFVELMNDKADELGLSDTHFTNPHGLDDPAHYSSPADLLTLAEAALAVPEIASAVRQERVELAPAPDGTPRVAVTTNRLLSEYPGAIGVKTGFTFRAGLVLVAAAEHDGRRLYAVVMGSEGEHGHFQDAVTLLDYGFGELAIAPAAVVDVSFLRPSPLTADGSAEAATRAALRLVAGGLGVEEAEGLELPEPEDLQPVPGIADAARWWWR